MDQLGECTSVGPRKTCRSDFPRDTARVKKKKRSQILVRHDNNRARFSWNKIVIRLCVSIFAVKFRHS